MTHVYGAYVMKPKQYYYKDGTYKAYVKFFESELDCARYCMKHIEQDTTYNYDSIYIEPDSKKITQEHYNITYRDM